MKNFRYLLLALPLFFFGEKIFPQSTLAFGNPGVTATIGLAVSVLPTLFFHFFNKRK